MRAGFRRALPGSALSRAALLAAAIWAAPLPGGRAAAQFVAGGFKPPLCGLVAMGPLRFLVAGGPPDNSLREVTAHPGLYAGAVLNVTWAELEPGRGRFDFATIDRGLARVAADNAAGNAGPALRAKLRVFAGRAAPDWVKAMSGGMTTVQGTRFTMEVPRFWTAPYRQAWQELQQALATRYDADPRLAEVAVSSCATLSDEPFVLPATQAGIAALHQAGFTDAAYRACLAGAIEDYAPWRRTALDYTFAPFRDTDSRASRWWMPT